MFNQKLLYHLISYHLLCIDQSSHLSFTIPFKHCFIIHTFIPNSYIILWIFIFEIRTLLTATLKPVFSPSFITSIEHHAITAVVSNLWGVELFLKHYFENKLKTLKWYKNKWIRNYFLCIFLHDKKNYKLQYKVSIGEVIFIVTNHKGAQRYLKKIGEPRLRKDWKPMDYSEQIRMFKNSIICANLHSSTLLMSC